MYLANKKSVNSHLCTVKNKKPKKRFESMLFFLFWGGEGCIKRMSGIGSLLYQIKNQSMLIIISQVSVHVKNQKGDLEACDFSGMGGCIKRGASLHSKN